MKTDIAWVIERTTIGGTGCTIGTGQYLTCMNGREGNVMTYSNAELALWFVREKDAEKMCVFAKGQTVNEMRVVQYFAGETT